MSTQTPLPRSSKRTRALFLGPAFVAAIGYIDPGNYATNIQAGADYGYLLLWVVVWANLMAALIQMLSAKLGLATGESLASQLGKRLPRWAVYPYWIQAEILAMATDIAEFVGAALGFKLLFGFTLMEGAIITAIISMAHSLNLTVVAEGVETAAQLEFLQEKQCDEAQGLLFSQPVSAPALTKLLQAGGNLWPEPSS